MTAHEWYVLGNERRRHGDFAAAINCYMQAVELDADSPAATAMQMLQDILNYRNTDMLNP